MALFLKNGLLVAKLITWPDTTRLAETTGVWQVSNRGPKGRGNETLYFFVIKL